MLNHADTFIFLSGDLATLEALITFASWAHLNIHQKPIGLLNVNNFYNGLLAFINHVIKNHFIPICAKQSLCASTDNDLLDPLQAYKPKPDPRTLALEWLTNDGNPSPSKKYKLDLTLQLQLSFWSNEVMSSKLYSFHLSYWGQCLVQVGGRE